MKLTDRQRGALGYPMTRAEDLDLDRAASDALYKGERWSTILTVNR